jgi:ribose transport system permease protein
MATEDSVERTPPAKEAPEAGGAGIARAAAVPLHRTALGWIAGVKELNILIALGALCTFLSFASPYFLETNNLLGVTRAFSLTAIAAMGQTMVIITGGIDLSVGSVLALSGLSTGMLLERGWPLLPAMVAGLLVGTVAGFINGLLVTKIGLPPFIATLGTLSIGRGLVYVLTKGYPVTVPRGQDLLIELGQGYVGPVPVPVIVMLGVTILGTIFLSQSALGRYIYAVGGNEEAARLAGINVAGVKLLVYTLSGTLAGLAGMILLARLVSAQPSAGLGFELPVIAAAIIGGTSLLGGEGTVLGAVLGAAIIGVLENGMVLLNVNTYAQQAVTGTVIILAVSLDIWHKRRRQRG